MPDSASPSHLSRRRFVARLPLVAGVGLGAAASVSAQPAAAPPLPSGVVPLSGVIYNVRQHGARGDGTTLDTASLQAAIDACAAGGGGTVLLPPGRFLSGTLTLKDNVTFHLSPGAVLLGSPRAADYPPKPYGTRDLDVGGFEIWALLYADGARNIAVEGRGLIDGNGKPFPPRAKIQPLDVASGARPRGIFLKDCQRVTLRDFRHVNSGLWAVHLALCEQVAVEGISLFSEHFVQQDGIIIDSSRDVRVSNCTINTVDDALVFKSSYPVVCENITVTNCVLTCESSALKFGTQSLGGFRNLAISNCAFHRCRLGGLKFEAIDGGVLEDVVVSNITMVDVSAPFFFKIGNRARDFGFKDVPQPQPVGRVRNISISNVRARLLLDETLYQGGAINPAERRGYPYRVANTVIIGGLPGHPVENITLTDIHLTCPGGGTAEEARRTGIPEEEKRYPENDMFGILPCWGFYIRHATGVRLANVRLDLRAPDHRSVVIAEDVTDLEIDGLKAETHGEHFIRLRDTRTAAITRSRPLQPVDAFVEIAGAASTDITLCENHLRAAREVLRTVDGFNGAVAQHANLTGPA